MSDPEPSDPEVSDSEPSDSDLADDEIDDGGGDPVEPVGSAPTADAEDVPLFETPATPAHRPTGKPSVPSFDDILFGPGPGK